MAKKQPSEVTHLTTVDRPPGSLIYTGNYTDVSIEIELHCYSQQELIVKRLNRIDQLPDEYDPSCVYWINLIGLHDPEVISYFGRRFGIHEMHLEDIVQVNRHAKVDNAEDYIMSEHYMIYRDEQIHHESIVLFLLRGVVLSFQEYTGDVFGPIRHRLQQPDSPIRHQGADYLYYLMLDRLVDEAGAVLKDLVFQLDDLERLMLDENQSDMRRVYEIKRELLNVKTAVYPLDGLMPMLLGENNRVLSDPIIPYLKDVEDHVDQALVELGRAMDTIENMNQSNMAKLSNQMNSIMKVLTIFSAIFIPLNFITGMYGMNFTHMPFLQHPYAFYGFVVVSIAIVALLIGYFKRNHWF